MRQKVRFSEHAETHQQLSQYQSAYRAYHSTETAVESVRDNLARNVDQNVKVCVIVLLDLSSAFDPVDDEILLDVLDQCFGVTALVTY